MYLGWPAETRAEAVGPVHSRVGAYASNQRASVVMGQRKSTIMLSDVLQEGLVLLVLHCPGHHWPWPRRPHGRHDGLAGGVGAALPGERRGV